MPTSKIPLLATLLFLSAGALGCAPQQACPQSMSATALATPASATLPPRAADAGERRVYRFDFVLTGYDASGGPSSTVFTLNLQEAQKGEVVLGKNVPLTTPAPPGSGPSPVSPRQDVGTKVAAYFRTAGEDVILDVDTEMSAFDAPAIRKIIAKGSAVASAGKSALVMTIEDDHKKYQLTVTPTKLR